MSQCDGWKCERDATENRGEHYFCGDHAANYDYVTRIDAQGAEFAAESRALQRAESRRER